MFLFDWQAASTPLTLLTWLLVTLLAHQLVKFIPQVREFLPDCCQLYIIGMLAGIVVNLYFQCKFYLYPGGFLYLFSPFYQLEIDPLSILLFATLISPTDPVSVLSVFEDLHVNEQLFILVSGESLLNDAFGIVLYNSLSAMASKGAANFVVSDVVAAFLSFGTVGIGAILFGAIFAGLTSFWAKIVSCGLWMHKYLRGNLQEKEITTVETMLKTWATSSDAIIFSFLGLSTISLAHNWDWVFIAVTLGAIVLARFFAIFFLTFFVNQLKTEKISWKHQLVLAYAGIRGPICYGLVQSLDEEYVKGKDVMVTAAIVIIILTCLLQGLTIKPFLFFLAIEKEELVVSSVSDQRTNLTVGIEAIVGVREMDSWQQKCLAFNERYIEPVLMKKTAGSGLLKKIYAVMPQNHRNSNSSVLQQSTV